MSRSRIIIFIFHLSFFFSFFPVLSHAQQGNRVKITVDPEIVGIWSVAGRVAYVDAESSDTIGVAKAEIRMIALPDSSSVATSGTQAKGKFLLLKSVKKFYDKYLIKVSAKGFEDAEVTFDYKKDTSERVPNYAVAKKDMGVILIKKKCNE